MHRATARRWGPPVHRQLAVNLAVRKRLEKMCLRRKSLLHRQSVGDGAALRHRLQPCLQSELVRPTLAPSPPSTHPREAFFLHPPQ
jgi:hypothetical protein